MTGTHPGLRLVTVAHGTRHATGNRVAALLTEAAGERLGVPAVVSYVELHEPLFADVVRATGQPTVVVPLLLSTGYHMRTDLPAAVAAAPGPVALGRELGPDPLLARAQADRLVAAGATPGQPVVMVAAGSTDPDVTGALATAADLLAGAWGGPVRVATMAGHGARVPDVVRPGDAVSPYLLSPGHFATTARDQALVGGAAVVADVIGPHPEVVGLVCARVRALMAAPALSLG